jgi:cellobiose phosphorylase
MEPSKTGNILGHKETFSKYKKIEIIPCIPSDHNGLKLKINNKNSSKKNMQTIGS